jgi:hypothetical protein
VADEINQRLNELLRTNPFAQDFPELITSEDFSALGTPAKPPVAKKGDLSVSRQPTAADFSALGKPAAPPAASTALPSPAPGQPGAKAFEAARALARGSPAPVQPQLDQSPAAKAARIKDTALRLARGETVAPSPNKLGDFGTLTQEQSATAKAAKIAAAEAARKASSATLTAELARIERDRKQREAAAGLGGVNVPEVDRQRTVAEIEQALTAFDVAQKGPEAARKAPAPKYTKTRTAIDNFAKAALGMLPSVTRSAGIIAGLPSGTDENAATHLADEMEKNLEAMFPGDPARQEEFLSGALAGGAGSMSGFVLGGWVTKALKLPASVGTALLGAAAQGSQGQQEAKEAGAPYDDRIASFGWNAVFGAGEAVPIERFFQHLNKVSDGRVVGMISEGISQGLTEATQETLTQVGSNAIAQAIYDAQRELGEGVDVASLVGGILGGTMGLGVGAVQPGGDVRPGFEAAPRPQPQPQPAPAQPTARPQPAPTTPPPPAAPRRPPPAASTARPADDSAILAAAGYSPDDIAEMSAPERADTAQQLRDQGVTAAAPPPPPLAPQAPGKPVQPVPAPAASAPVRPQSPPVRPAAPAAGAVAPPPVEVEYVRDRPVAESGPDRLPDAMDDPMPVDLAGLPTEPTADDFSALGRPVAGAGTKTSPARIDDAADIDRIVKHVAEPSRAQDEANNFKQAHLKLPKLPGFTIAVQVPKGGTRRGVAPDGTEWEVKDYPAHYGRIKGTKAADGDGIDVFIGDNLESDEVYVIDQVDLATGKYDEVKAVVAAGSSEDAKRIYESAFSDGSAPDRVSSVHVMTVEQFRRWLKTADTTKPLDRRAIMEARRRALGTEPKRKGALKPGAADMKKPVTNMLKAAGGVDPNSPLAGELRHMGITYRTAPGLFRRGGRTAVDNFVASEHAIFANLPDDGNGYIPQETILEALRDESFGMPWRPPEQQDNARRAELDNEAHEASVTMQAEALLAEVGLSGDNDLLQRVVQSVMSGTDLESAVEQAVIASADEELIDAEKAVAEGETEIPWPDFDRSEEDRPIADAAGEDIAQAGLGADEAREEVPGAGEAEGAEAGQGPDGLGVEQTPAGAQTSFQRDPPLSESADNRVRPNAQLLRDATQREAFRQRGLSGLDAPLQREVLLAVFAEAQNPQIFDAVIKAVPVDVVDVLGRGKFSAEELFHDEAVFLDLLAANGNDTVTVGIDAASALVGAVARASAVGPSVSNVARVSEDGGATSGARDGDHSPRIEQTPEGAQYTIPGAEQISGGALAQIKADKPLQAKAPQKPADQGLFSDDSQQTDLVDMARKPEPKKPAASPALPAGVTLHSQRPATPEERRRRGVSDGEMLFSAVATRETPFSAEQGFGATYQEAEADALRRLKPKRAETGAPEPTSDDFSNLGKPAEPPSSEPSFEERLRKTQYTSNPAVRAKDGFAYRIKKESDGFKNEGDTYIAMRMPTVRGEPPQYFRPEEGTTWTVDDAVQRVLSMSGEAEAPPSLGVKPGASQRPEPQGASTEKGWRKIGVNDEGNPVFEDENGVRSYTRNGIRHTEAVSLRPTPGGMQAIVKTDSERGANYKPVDAAPPPSNITEAALSGEVSDDGPGTRLREEAQGVPEPDQPEDAGEAPGERGTALLPEGDRGAGGGDVRDAERPDANEQKPADGVLGQGESSRSDPGDGGRDRDERADPPTDTELADAKKAEEDRKARRRLNYRITEDDKIGQGGPKEKVRANIEAIRTLKTIAQEKRQATPAEKKILVRYSGWGAFAQDVFAQHKGEWAKERGEIADLLTSEEYAAARASTLNAHYTSEDVINGIWSAIEHLGFKGGRALEPSAGVGHFIGLAPNSVANKTDWSAVELDTITGEIAKLLYAGSDVNVQGFETFNRPNGFYDLAVSNVPFGDYRLRDPKRPSMLIHDYFFAKGLDMVRPGGVVAFVTSKGTLDKANDSVRQALAKKADFLGAIRLPGGKKGAFAGNAGTEVTTDIIFLRRKLPDAEMKKPQAWMDLKTIETPEGPTQINEYFADHPEMMLGEMRLVGTMYRADTPELVGTADDLGKRIAKAAKKMPKDAMLPRSGLGPGKKDVAPEPVTEGGTGKEGAFFLKDGKVYRKVSGVGMPQALAAPDADKITRLVAIRDVVNELLRNQATGKREGNDALRKELNKAYDAFVKKHGPISLENVTVTSRVTKAGDNVSIVKRPNFKKFSIDPDAFKVAAIEVYDPESQTAKKAAIFTDDILAASVEPTITSGADTIGVSLNSFGKLDIDAMASMRGTSRTALLRELGDTVFQNPSTSDYEPAFQYLAGDVVAKLEDAKGAAASDRNYERNVEALEKVQPQPLTRDDIRAPLGAGWLPADVMQEFLK